MHYKAVHTTTSLRRALVSLLMVALMIMAPMVDARSQQTPPTASPVESPAATPAATPIPLAEVFTQAEITTTALTNIKADLTAGKIISTTEAYLPVLAQEIDAGLSENQRILTSDPPLDTLRNLERRWMSLATKVGAKESELADRGISLDEEIKRLKQLDQVWTVTVDQEQNETPTPEAGKNTEVDQTAFVQAAPPPEILQRMQTVLVSIKQTLEEVGNKRAELLKLQNRLAEQDSRIADALTAVRAVQEKAISRLFVRESPVIWSREVWSGTGQNLRQETRASFSAQWRSLGAYVQRESGRFILHAIILILLMVPLYWARSRVRPWVVAEPSLDGVARVFHIPIAPALVLSILMTRWIYPDSPRMLKAFLGACALVPTIIILRQLMEKHLYPILNALVAFYFLDQLRAVSASVPVLSRLLFLVEALGGIVYLTWLIRSVKVAKVPRTEWNRLLRTTWYGAYVAVVVFCVAFVVNAVGYVSIASLVGNALLSSAYFAVIVYAFVRIADGVVMLLMRIRPLSLLGMVQHYRPFLRRRIQRFLRWMAVLIWTIFALDQLSLLTPAIKKLNTALSAEWHVGTLSLSLGDILAFLLTVWLAFLISKFVRFLLEEEVYPRVKLARGLPYAISTMLHYAILLIGFFFAIAAMGIDMNKFTILAGAFGVGLGFGLQDIINNFVSGVILLFERPVNVGDMIQVGNKDGELRRIGMRASVIRTLEGSEVIVPNGRLISDEVLNWTLSDQQRRIEISVGVAYGTDPERVIEVLTAVAEKHPDIMKEPPPHTLFLGFGDSALNFQLRAWTNRFARWVVLKSELTVGVNAALRDAAIEIPFPQLDLHFQKDEANKENPQASASNGSDLEHESSIASER